MTDRGYFPLSTTGLRFTSFEASPALGAQDGQAFRTSVTTQSGLLTVYGANGARGQLRLDLFARPDRVEIRRGSQSLDALTLSEGSQVQLSYHALAGGRTLFASRDLVSAAVTGGIATLDANGLLTITGRPGQSGTISLTIAGVTRTIPLTVASAFPDIVGHWAENHSSRMRRAGVVTGIATDQGTLFFPNRTVTRAEFSAMFTRLLGLDVSQYVLTGQEFVDHAEIPAWARRYVAAMFQNGYITGSPAPGGVRFNARAPITRAEAFTILGRMLDFEAPPDTLDRFTDQAQIPGWARAHIARLVHAGLVTGSGGRLTPQNNLTRAEAATILSRLDLSALQHLAEDLLAEEAPSDVPSDADEDHIVPPPEDDQALPEEEEPEAEAEDLEGE